MLPEEDAVSDVGQQAQYPSDPEADQLRLAYAPERNRERGEVWRQRNVVPGQKVEQQRHGKRYDDRAQSHREQDLLAPVREHGSPSRAGGGSWWPACRGLSRPRSRPDAARTALRPA